MLGLSTQVPADFEYLSDGPNKEYVIGNIHVHLKHTNPKDIRNLSYKTGVVVQSMKTLGQKTITQDVLVKIGDQLTLVEVNKMKEECNGVSRWVYEYIKKLAEVKKDD